MNDFVIIIICIVMVGSLYWLYEMLKARYVVRNFFDKALEAEQLYGLYTLSEYKKIGSERVEIAFKFKVTTEDIVYILDLAEEAISYYDENCLRDLEEQMIDQIYDRLTEIAIELRRWLWVNTTNR